MDPVTIDLKNADVLQELADVLVLKHAQGMFGVDRAVVQALRAGGLTVELPQPGEHLLIATNGSLPTAYVLFMGVVPLSEFGYAQIREFSRDALALLAEKMPHARQVAFTLHGADYGLDEREAFKAELAGIVEAIQHNQCPPALKSVHVVEIDKRRADHLKRTLDTVLPNLAVLRPRAATTLQAPAPTASLQSAGAGSEEKPHVFVAMPFAEDMDDVYHYGIQNAVNAAGYLCERADLSTFTGDILDRVRSRIRSASLLVADLSGANPNVYLEVGYAWGVAVPTVLVVRNPEDLKFDVRGQRCLVYKKIQDLEDSLTRELTALKAAPSST